MEVVDESIPRTYVLCPDTVFLIGDLNDGGQYPILPRSNVAYKCGDEGLSSNNCVIRGGAVQLITIGFDGDSSVGLDNVLVSGLTFESADIRSVVLDKPGEITFVDCVLQVRGDAVALFGIAPFV
jgi:hypothetical protein